MTDKTKNNRHYWAVFNSEGVLFEGTFTECWDYFVEHYSELTVGYLAEHGTRIGRKS